jgi:uncharacterized membrane protein YcjF (UPF0283 family)
MPVHDSDAHNHFAIIDENPFSRGRVNSNVGCSSGTKTSSAKLWLSTFPLIVAISIFGAMKLLVYLGFQFRRSQWAGYAWAAVACIAMGILVEVAEGISGTGHCRLRIYLVNSDVGCY